MVKKTAPKKTQKTNNKSKDPGLSPSGPVPASTAPPSPQLSTQEQQRLLDIFAAAFSNVLASDDFSGLLQEIKTALFNRDFATAFGREDYLEAYAARWSPTRALAYATILLDIEDHIRQCFIGDASVEDQASQSTTKEGITSAEDTSSSSNITSSLKMVSIGGCAAEHLAFASHLHKSSSRGSLVLVDSAPWSEVTSLLHSRITTPPTLSKYASAAVKSSNAALVSASDVTVDFVQQDVLSLDSEKLAHIVGASPLIVTMLFTLNELYTSGGLGITTKFLKNLGNALPHGSLLLVVDSPGSYSETAIGQEKKRYPMQWLLSHTLLETASLDYTWEKLESQDSVWFRVPEELSYPIPLENMRYQMHLYKIKKDS